MNIMERAIRIECYQNTANYRKPSSFIIKRVVSYASILKRLLEWYMLCADLKEYHPMKVKYSGNELWISVGTIYKIFIFYGFKV